MWMPTDGLPAQHVVAHRQARVVSRLEHPDVREPVKIGPQAVLHAAEINPNGGGRDKPFLWNKSSEKDPLIVLPVLVHAQLTSDFVAQSTSNVDPRIRIDRQQPIRSRTCQQMPVQAA